MKFPIVTVIQKKKKVLFENQLELLLFPFFFFLFFSTMNQESLRTSGLIHSLFNKYLRIDQIPGIVLKAGNNSNKAKQNPYSSGTYILERKDR